MDQLPTGGGKTPIAAAQIAQFQALVQGRAHCWVTHRKELRGQSAKHLRNYGLQVVNMDEQKVRKWHPNAVNMVSPALRTLPSLKGVRLGVMIIDEAHHTPAGTWARLIKEWQHYGGYVVGFTATPWRLSKKQGFEEWYNVLIKGPSVQQLQKKGYLATPRVLVPTLAKIDDHNAQVMSTGDYSYEWMDDEISMLLAHKPVLEFWNNTTKGRKDKRTLWFVPTVHCAKELCALLSSNGESAKVLTAQTPSEDRARMLAALNWKRLTHLVSVDVLGEGVDIPSVPIIASLRPTKSLVIWLQQCGRGSRPKNKIDGGYYTVIDYASNSLRHGTPDSEREWSLKPRLEMSSKLPQDITARCYNERCEDIQLHPSVRTCWGCGLEQYFVCEECQIHRRWTQFKKGKVCAICAEYFAEQKAKEEQAEANKRRRVQAERDKQWKLVTSERIRATEMNRRLYSRIKPYKRAKIKNEQLKLF